MCFVVFYSDFIDMRQVEEIMDYKETLNLPQTSFPMKANLVKKEPEQIKKWEEMNLYHKIRQTSKGREIYILHDGPPYAQRSISIWEPRSTKS